MSLCVWLGSEGRNELGGWDGHPVYQNDQPGVIETLLRGVRGEGWQVVEATKWSRIRKLQAGKARTAEQKNVLALALDAREAKCQVLAFVRDADGDADRIRDIDEAIGVARARFPNLQIVGGTAVNVLEAWVLAAKGHSKTESLGKVAAQTRLKEAGLAPKDTVAMVSAAANVRLATLPADAASLRAWLRQADEALKAEL